MPVLAVLLGFLDLITIAHVIKTDRERYWISVILFFPVIGALTYFAVEMLPDLRKTRTGRRVVKKFNDTIDPQRELRRLSRNLRIADTIENRIQLADECIEREMYEDAISLLKESLQGINEHSPDIMLRLARVYFLQEHYIQTKQTLNELIAENPDFKSKEGHLLYARTLVKLEEYDSALEEYEILVTYYPGLEALGRYGLLLHKLGDTEKAQHMFNTILDKMELLPRDAQHMEKQWIDYAETHLAPSAKIAKS